MHKFNNRLETSRRIEPTPNNYSMAIFLNRRTEQLRFDVNYTTIS